VISIYIRSSESGEKISENTAHEPKTVRIETGKKENIVMRATKYGLNRTRTALRIWRYRLTEGRTTRRLLVCSRKSIEYGGLRETPLVSVLIPTFQNSDVLVERTLPSVLSQTYQDFEVVIVGDACSDEHVQRIRSWMDDRNDPRIRFYNLPERGSYPSDPHCRWCVAGVTPANKAIELARGEWLAPLDDDDEFTKNHIESLLRFATNKGLEFVYGIAHFEKKDGSWMELGSAPLRHAQICHLSVLYHRRLAFFRYDIDAWKYAEPADWNMWWRMKEAGAKMGFLPEVVGIHYREKSRSGI
jgi:glycosyltransferase involved in cell wall biosynthesis